MLNEDVDVKYKRYALDVVAGKIVACKYVKQACQRYLDFFQKYEFRAAAVDKVVNFISHLKHYSGKFAGQFFRLQDYQFFIVCAIFGFYKSDNTRLVRYVYVELARKSGKTALMSAILLYMLAADNEQAAEIQLIANSAKQAQICFKMCSNFLQSIDTKSKYFKRYRDSIKFDKTKSSIQVVASDASRLDGSNLHAFLLDEAHEMKTPELWNVCISSQGMRTQPLGIIITTAGFNKNGFCYNYRATCLDILSGVKQQDNQFCAIYTLDKETEFDDEKCWVKANPSLDITISRDYLREQVQNAKNNSTLETGVKTKNFNLWCSTSQTWIERELLLKHSEKFELSDEKFSGLYSFGGLDLAEVSDLTAVSWMLPLDNKFYFKTKYYYPIGKLENDLNKELYKEWHRDGFLTLTTGDVTDYDFILNDLVDANKHIYYNSICYDPYNAAELTFNAQNLGIPMQSYSQSLWHFNIPTKSFERLLKIGKIVIDYNPITLWCFENVALKSDWNSNVKPVKGGAHNLKIDGVISMIEALGGFIETPQYDELITT